MADEQVRTQVAELATALLARNGPEWARLADALDPAMSYKATLVMAAVAIYRRWPQDPSDADISEYAAAAGARALDEGSTVSVPAIEAVILGSFGEHERTRGMGPDELIPASLVIVHSIQDEGFLTETDRDGYIREVLEELV